MRRMIWLAPDGHRYTVEVVQEPFDRRQSIIFRRDDGWTGVASVNPDDDLRSIMSDELAELLARARG